MAGDLVPTSASCRFKSPLVDGAVVVFALPGAAVFLDKLDGEILEVRQRGSDQHTAEAGGAGDEVDRDGDDASADAG
jgi:hypothetical protein